MARMLNNLALTGVPRGGTTLACHLLGQASDALSLFEPMSVEALPTEAEQAADAVQAYLADVRAQVHRTHRAPSKHYQGKVPDNPYGERAGASARPLRVELGEIAVDKPLTEHFHLIIKHNAAFIAILPALAKRMPVLGVVRHPLAVLLSWHSVDLAVTHGRLPAGERMDAGLAARLTAEPDVLARQLAILDWCFARLVRHLPAQRLLRYEDMVADGGAGLLRVAGLAGDPAVGLHDRNASQQYDRAIVARLAAALLAHGGPAVALYGRAAVARLAETLLARRVDDAG